MSLSKKNQAYRNAKKDARKKELGLIKPGKQIQNAKKNAGMYSIIIIYKENILILYL